jgi:hypothetical protein
MVRLVAETRANLRDYPKFFDSGFGPVVLPSIRLPHPLVEGDQLQVYDLTDPQSPVSVTAGWSLDERNGVLMHDGSLLKKMLSIAGYYSTWFLNADLVFYVNKAATEFMQGRSGVTVDELPDIELDLIATGATYFALWSLVTEFSTDIDVSTPEGMNIPARQRFAQVWQLMGYWESEYYRRAQALNAGIFRIENFFQRRVAKLTNRLVPLYKPREFDDPCWPMRLLPEIDEHIIVPPDTEFRQPGLDIYAFSGDTGSFVPLETTGPQGPPGRSVQVFEQPQEPEAAVPGDIWVQP